ncbi:MAG TPA: helix-turn-helix domain-containing protein [Mycobacterium sp.]|nr:helix-turn-helix domain-containing protein [Mycobacterium sp.]
MQSPDRRFKVADARLGYLATDAADPGAVSDFVAASWRRSRGAGVAADGGEVPFIGDVDISSRLLRCSQPIIDRLIDATEDIPLSIALSDNKARVLTRVDTTRTIGLLLDNISLAPGFDYAEGHIGTNGVGTVLEAGRSAHIVGPEHFHERFQAYSCSGAPIHDPMTGHIEGVLDLTCLTEHSTPMLHSIARSAANEIEQCLLHDRSLQQQALFEAFLRVDSHSKSAVFAIGGRVMMANALAQSTFDPAEQRVIAHHARYLMESRSAAEDEIELPGERLVRLRGTRVSAGSEIAGIVVEVREAQERSALRSSGIRDTTRRTQRPRAAGRSSIASSRTGALGQDSHSPLWRRACRDVTDALNKNESLLVIGEPGTGKFTLIATTFHHIHPGSRTIELDANDLTHDSAGNKTFETTVPTVYILRRLQDLTPEGVTKAQAFLNETGLSERPVCVAATVSESCLDTGPVPDLLPHFQRSASVPPLRHRIDDLPELTRQILAKYSRGRSASLTAAAMRTMARYTWPGNVRQLDDALRTALGHRPVGEIQSEDLPGYCYQTSGRTLSALESIERDAIVLALREAGGNRVQAAAALGIARSSLYRKLNNFGIEVD